MFVIANHTLRLNACGHAFGQFRPEIPLVLVLLELVPDPLLPQGNAGDLLDLVAEKAKDLAAEHQLKKHED